MRVQTWILSLLMLFGGVSLTPPAAADCGDCIEDCHVTVRAVQLGVGCSIAHEPRQFWTACMNACGPELVACHAWENARDPGCTAPVVASVLEPHCQQVFVGPDIDQGLCHDFTRDTCQLWWYDTYGTGGGDRCYV